jgi:hypothetical protein
MTTYIKQGFGFTVGYDFARATVDTPLAIDAGAFPKAGYVFGWIAGNPDSRLGFLRGNREGKVRVCVRKDGLGDAARDAAVDSALLAWER